MKVLILASNPRKDLSLDREIRDLKAVIENARLNEGFEIEDALAVRVGDLQDLLFKHRPQFVHFCGHGSGLEGLVFENERGGEQWVDTDALSELFRLFSSDIRCVILNACYSEVQANAIVNNIDYVIGMQQEIQDEAAIAFSKGFYRALGYGCSVEQAYEFGCNAIQLEISGTQQIFRSVTTAQQRTIEIADAVATTDIPEHLKPILKCKPHLSPMSSPAQKSRGPTLSQETRSAIQLAVAQALLEDKPGSHTGSQSGHISSNIKQTASSNAQAASSRNRQIRRLSGLLPVATVALLVTALAIALNRPWQPQPTRNGVGIEPERLGRELRPLKTNAEGLELIKAFEGLRLVATELPGGAGGGEQPTEGLWVIGYGTTKGIRPGMRITPAQAELLLVIDLEPIEAAVMEMVEVPLNEDQLSALVSLAYNIGPSAVANSTLIEVLNQGDYRQAADKFLIWDKAGGSNYLLGLSLRRQAERALFLGHSPQPFINTYNQQKQQ